MQLPPGARLGSYEIISPLGAGGMGEVYRARDTKLGREVAIKALPEEFARDTKHVARFQREARLLASLNHPNIGSIYGLEEADERSYLILEFVEGHTLAERLRKGPLPPAETIRVCRQIAAGLEAAHENGVVHRDLKPGNVMLTRTDEVKVLDFGLAKDVDATGDQSLTSGGVTTEGTILGTAPYMSPEQARGQLVDRRTDIWAFGCVLYECLTGRVLFLGANHMETIARVQYADPDYEALPAATPPRVKELLRRCLTRDVRLRLRDIGEARITLDALESGDVESAPVEHTQSRRRYQVAWTAAAFCAVASIGLGTLLWRRLATAPAPPRFEKVTFAPQFISNARFAADGRTLVFSAAREGNVSELFVRHPEEPQPRPLGGQDVQLLSVSSKGELAVLTRSRFLHHRTYIGTLAKVPLAGASPREILGDVTAADWSPDGTELAVIRQVEGKSRLEYPVGTVVTESEGYLSDVRFAPKDDRIAFMQHAFAFDNRGSVMIVDRSGTLIVKSPEYWGMEGLTWSAGGDLLFTASDGGANYSVRALAMDGSVRDVLTGATGLVVHDVNSNGRLLVSTHMERESMVVRFPNATVERDLPWLGASTNPVLSRDGRTLVFTDQSQLAGTNYAVYLQASVDSPPIRLGDGMGIDISPDGASVLVVVMTDPPRLMIYPTGAGEPRDISTKGLVSYDWISARFFFDGSGVSFCGNEGGKVSRCYVRDLAGGAAYAVTPEGTSDGYISPDGRAMLAHGIDGGYQLYPLDGSAPTPVPSLTDHERIVTWRQDGRSLLVYDLATIPTRVERVDLSTGERTLVRELAPTDLAGALQFYGVAFSADESAYAYSLHRVLNTLFVVDGVR